MCCGRWRAILWKGTTDDDDRLVTMECQGPAAIFKARFGAGRNAVGECNRIADMQPLAVADEGLPAAQIDPLVQRRADPRRAAVSFQLRRDNAGIVEHQHIACPQQPRQIAHGAIVESALPRQDQHPRRIARAHRAQCYAFGREVEIEQVYAHDFGLGQREVFDKLRLSGRWKRGNAQDPLVLSLSSRRRPQVSYSRKSRSI